MVKQASIASDYTEFISCFCYLFLGYISTLRNNVRSRAWGAAIGCSYRVEKCCIVKVMKAYMDISYFLSFLLVNCLCSRLGTIVFLVLVALHICMYVSILAVSCYYLNGCIIYFSWNLFEFILICCPDFGLPVHRITCLRCPLIFYSPLLAVTLIRLLVAFFRKGVGPLISNLV